MYHEGDLRSAIALSLTQGKLLTCFIYEEDHEQSIKWDKILKVQADLIEAKAVLVRFLVTSQETSYLDTFCPIKNAPTIVIINNGAVVEKLEASLTESETLLRLRKALQSAGSPKTWQEVQQTPSSKETDAKPGAASPTASENKNLTTSTTTSASSSRQPTAPVQSQPSAAEKLAKQKADRLAQAESRHQEADAQIRAIATGTGNQKLDAKEVGRNEVRAAWIKQQSKRKQEQAIERDRILKQIESDRQERRARSAINKENVIASEPLVRSEQSKSNGTAGRFCNIQIRLPDGESIRGRFEASDTLSGAVRAWISDAARADTIKNKTYTLKLLRPPRPSKAITAAEEQETLAQLDMLPSATLVAIEQNLKQVQPGSILGKLQAFLYAFYLSIINTVCYILGIGNSGSSGQESRDTAQDLQDNPNTSLGKGTGIDGGSSSIKHRTTNLAQSRARDMSESEHTEFYNGNSSAFEGRKDDDEGS